MRINRNSTFLPCNIEMQCNPTTAQRSSGGMSALSEKRKSDGRGSNNL